MGRDRVRKVNNNTLGDRIRKVNNTLVDRIRNVQVLNNTLGTESETFSIKYLFLFLFF